MKRRDKRLGAEIARLYVPEPASDFFEQLEEQLDDVERTAPARAIPESTGQPGPRDIRTKTASDLAWLRPRTLAPALVAVAAVLVIGVVAVTGGPSWLPEAARPQVATAAEVTAAMRSAIERATGMTGRLTLSTWDSADAAALTSEWTFAASADGSYIVRGTNTYPDGTVHSEATAYDAATGTERHLTAEGDAPPTCYERTGLAAGRPDAAPADWALSRRLGSVVRALQVAGDASVTETTYEGRAAWVLEAEVQPNRIATFPVDRISVTVDRETGFPVRVVETGGGSPVSELTITDIVIDPVFTEDAFELEFPPGAAVYADDYGFDRVLLEEAAAAVGYDVLTPAWLPEGYRLSSVSVATDAMSTGKEGMNPASRGVVSLAYRRGFDTLVITTRLVGEDRSAWTDPLSSGEGFIDEPKLVTLGGGTLQGITAEMLVDPLTVPHLWAIGDQLVVTVAGDASAAELQRIAESLSVLPNAAGD